MKPEVSIVKIGGALLEDPDQVDGFCRDFAALKGAKVLVHGGGRKASELSERLGITPRMIDGRRITDGPSLEVAVMVYAGWANKSLVAKLQALECRAIGMSGADADLIRASKRPVREIDYGFVGDVERVNSQTLTTLLEAGWVPVCCALTHDGNGQLLNTNADTIAAELAIALGQHYNARLYYCFEKAGVLLDVNDPDSLIPRLDREACQRLTESGQIAAGMLPKLHNCFQALDKGVRQVFVGPPSQIRPSAETYTEIAL